MADIKQNAPVQPPIDPKQLATAALFTTPEGREFLASQAELNQLQLEEARERRQSVLNQRAQTLAARANHARQSEANRKHMLAKQAQCQHRHANNQPALGGQRFARGGLREWVLRCQLCGKEYDNKNPPPEGLYVAFENFGGPNF